MLMQLVKPPRQITQYVARNRGDSFWGYMAHSFYQSLLISSWTTDSQNFFVLCSLEPYCSNLGVGENFTDPRRMQRFRKNELWSQAGGVQRQQLWRANLEPGWLVQPSSRATLVYCPLIKHSRVVDETSSSQPVDEVSKGLHLLTKQVFSKNCYLEERF